MTTTIKHKRGDTFSWGGTVILPTGRAWSGRCHLRPETNPDGGQLGAILITLAALSAGQIADQNITVPPGGAAFAIALYASAVDTRLWQADIAGKKMLADVEFYDPADIHTVTSTDSFIVQVFKDPTHA